MLVDPLPVKSLSIGSHTAITVPVTDTFALVDLAPGKTVRKCPALSYNGVLAPAILTISHSVSKENGDVPTDRVLVRIDLSSLRTATGVAGNVKAYAYLVVGVPRGTLDTGNYAFDPVALIQCLIGAVAVSPTAATLSELNLVRILAGEP
uniref:Uncharacterized protein n=1 Tax=Leviviridae sp. TaxID=2027243 RepID=A0A514D4D0_9VIRU|nr:MAG: hypothetical protein H4Bulk46313_000003 [Leviviridae sp.]